MSSGVQHMLILWTAFRSKTDLKIVNRAVKSLCINGRDGISVNTCRSSKLGERPGMMLYENLAQCKGLAPLVGSISDLCIRRPELLVAGMVPDEPEI